MASCKLGTETLCFLVLSYVIERNYKVIQKGGHGIDPPKRRASFLRGTSGREDGIHLWAMGNGNKVSYFRGIWLVLPIEFAIQSRIPEL